jgi:uncharacterized membrane protein
MSPSPPQYRCALESRRSEKTIETIIRLEEAGENDRPAVERLSELIGRFAGTIAFVICQVVAVSVWVALNGRQIGAVRPFDPFPFPLLSCVLSGECVLLTAFVLIRQNRMSLRADRRNHLGLQITLLSEKEVTKVIQMLERMSRQMGIERQVTDAESKELAEDTSIENIARELRENLEAEVPSTRDIAADT